MIHIIIGTKAQLIKMAPIMRRLQERGVAYNYIATGQHQSTMADIHANFGIRGPDIRLYSGPDITSIVSMVGFGARILWKTLRKRAVIFHGDRNGIVLIHGDTFSTLLGALMGRLCGVKVGHVESGLRSFKLLAPFPEELTRLAVFWLAHYYFCPGEWPLENLKRMRGIKVNTGANTLADALGYALSASNQDQPGLIPEHPFVVVTLHRFENIRSPESMKQLVDAVFVVAERHQLLFVLHVPTEIRLRRFGYYERLAAHPNIQLRPRYDYFDFMRLIQHAEFVVSDGGSNQEECYYLGKPLLLLREVTERQEGLGTNAVLSRFDRKVIQNFLSLYQELTRPLGRPRASPSEVIIDACRSFQSLAVTK